MSNKYFFQNDTDTHKSITRTLDQHAQSAMPPNRLPLPACVTAIPLKDLRSSSSNASRALNSLQAATRSSWAPIGEQPKRRLLIRR